jgi:serine/threonine-protein kinase
MTVSQRDAPSRFGPYRVIRLVGSGGMGSVYEAEDTGLGHRVALKLLHPHVSRRAGATKRFLREGRAAARVQHPHVVQILSLGVEGDAPYLAMELLDGDDLSQAIERRGRLPLEEALEVLLPVVAAVAAAHDAGVIHRDLKPSNVCFRRGPGARIWPKVVDFGVSKVIADDQVEGTITDGIVGTAAYMAPEQARTATHASFASDQYSLGVILYQCVTGALPFAGRGVMEIFESMMTAPVAPPSARTPGLPAALDEAVLRAMSRDPAARFPSVRAFGAALLGMAREGTRAAMASEFGEEGGWREATPTDALTVESGSHRTAPDTSVALASPRVVGPAVASAPGSRRRKRAAVMTLAIAGIAGLAVAHAARLDATTSPAMAPRVAGAVEPLVGTTAAPAPVAPAPVAPAAVAPAVVGAQAPPGEPVVDGPEAPGHASGGADVTGDGARTAHLGRETRPTQAATVRANPPRPPAKAPPPTGTPVPIAIGDNGAPIIP